MRIDDQVAKVGRNQPCPCGSGKKFKRCHGTYSLRVVEQAEDLGGGSLYMETTQRARAYTVQDLIRSRASKSIPQMERISLTIGGASSIPADHSHLAMFQRVYRCLPELWDFKDDPRLILFERERYQVELRRREVRILVSRSRPRTGADGDTVLDVDAGELKLDEQGYYCCATAFVDSSLDEEVEGSGIATVDRLAGLISLTMTPDLVREPIWEATYYPGDERWRMNNRRQMFRVGLPSVVPETFASVNALAAASQASRDGALSSALRFLANEASTESDAARFIWFYLAIRVLVDDFYSREWPGQESDPQERRFRYYANKHFPGESQIVDDFQKIYGQRNNLLKGVDWTIISPDDGRRAYALCHKLLKREMENILPS